MDAYLNSLQGSAVIKNPSSHENAPNKNNIILMNPEIHVHNNNKSASGSPNNVEEIKKLQAELKIKQDRIDLERTMRESVERQRHAENLINEKLLREKNKQIQEQNEILNRQAQFLSEHQALLKEFHAGQAYGSREEINRLVRVTPSNPAFQSKYQGRPTRKRKHRKNNKSFDNHANKMQNNSCVGRRSRSKTENNFENNPMELWEWDGKRWIHKNKKSNNSTPNQVSLNRDSVVQSSQLLTSNVRQERTENQVFNLNAAGTELTEPNNEMNLTYLSQQALGSEVTIPMYTGPTDISVSFDEREITDHLRHDLNLFRIAKKNERTTIT